MCVHGFRNFMMQGWMNLKIIVITRAYNSDNVVFFSPLWSVFLQSALDWWPKIDAVYCHSVELRNMFGETLHKALQGCGAHPAIRMAPVREIVGFESHLLSVVPLVSLSHYCPSDYFTKSNKSFLCHKSCVMLYVTLL